MCVSRGLSSGELRAPSSELRPRALEAAVSHETSPAARGAPSRPAYGDLLRGCLERTASDISGRRPWSGAGPSEWAWGVGMGCVL